MPSLASLTNWFRKPNPHKAALAHLQEQLDQKSKKLAEASLLWGDNFGWPDSPMGQRYGPGEFGAGGGLGYGNAPYPWIDRSINKTHAPLPLLTEWEWRLGVAASQDLCTRNHLAISFKEFVSNYVGPCQVQFVLRGQTPATVAAGPADADGDGSPDTDPLIAKCQQVWDEWAELNDWGQGEEDREAECRDRLFRHGEAVLRFFQGGPETDGLPVCRHVEPELIRSPPNAADHQKWGIETKPGDAETVTRIYQCRTNEPSAGEWVDALKYVRVKANVDRTIKRGLPDLFPVAAHLRRVVGLLENMGEVAKLQAAIAWIQKYGPAATQSQVAAAITQGQDFSALKIPTMPGGSAKNVSFADYYAASIIHAENGRQFEPGPMATGVPGFVQVEQTILRGVGLRWGCPQFFSGEGGDSFASSLVTGSPFARATEARQERMKGFTRSVAKKVLQLAEASGRLPTGASQQVKVLVTCKPVVFADEEKQARVFETELRNKVLDPQEWIKKRGRDPKVVAANIAAWQAKFPGGPDGGGLETKQVMDKDGVMRTVRAKPPEQAGGKDPTPAPPGSAGGDGSSPVGESVREDRSGLVQQRITDKNGVQRTVWVRPEDAAPEHHPNAPPAEHIHAGLAEKIAAADPEAAKQPGLMAKLGDKALTVAAKVYAVMVKATPAALSVLGVLENVFDTPEDMKKLGYNPVTSSGLAGHDNGDPMRANAGISSHLAATIASHVLARVVTWAKGKAAAESDGFDEAGAILAQALAVLAAEWGLAEPPDAAALAAKLRELVK